MSTTCAECRDAISDYVDGTLDAATRRSVDAHLDGCPECAALARDFDLIRSVAGTLEHRVPPPGVWPQLEASLRSPADVRRARLLHWRARRVVWYGWLAAAAALIVAVGVSLVFVLRDSPPPSTTATRPSQQTSPPAVPSGNAEAPDSVESIEAELRLAEQHYEKAISGLEKIAAAQQRELDPQVAATLQKNLGVIDQAISESRAALRAQPSSIPAQESLFEALRRKVGLLQDAIALMNEMRKGNQAGAAQIVEGLSKS